MSYNDQFYDSYKEFLKEPVVRRNHDRVFQVFRLLAGGPLQVLDLGCGTGEFSTYCPGVSSYLGVDKVASPAARVVLDYTQDLSSLSDHQFNCFVSLFSIEACYPAKERYALYNKVFKEFPYIDRALVSGFYYEHAAGQETVEEVSGLTSYQTIEPLESNPSDVFEESRMVMRTPSAFFGSDVVEVWKFLERR